jgi:2-oxo-4-hydroxy-4-carboxy-5-ureidoimidazoline decarboxylase
MERLSLDQAPDDEARALLRSCCGSSRWVERMVARRPFGSLEGLLGASRDTWFSLSDADWREAFDDHPRIGDRAALRDRFPDSGHLASNEQAGVDGASEAVLEALQAGNDAYVRKFGFIFIVCATGLTAGEMLRMLEERLPNDPADEIEVAAGEQAKITELRLKKLIL